MVRNFPGRRPSPFAWCVPKVQVDRDRAAASQGGTSELVQDLGTTKMLQLVLEWLRHSVSWPCPGVGGVQRLSMLPILGLGRWLLPSISYGKRGTAGFKDTFLCQLPPGAKKREVGFFVQHPMTLKGYSWEDWAGACLNVLESPGSTHTFGGKEHFQTWQGPRTPSFH